MFGFDDLTNLRDVESRSITAENPEGEVGAGGRAVSTLGPGRKGRAFIALERGKTETVADIEGPGTIRHVWFTVPPESEANEHVLRDVILRMYWDGEDDPSVEVPLGDFFCNGHAVPHDVESVPIVVAPTGGMNVYFPMPFRDGARITVENDHPVDVEDFFYQVDYELGPVATDAAYFHAQWRRENPTTPGEDFTIADGIGGEGQYVGTYLAWVTPGNRWWGEGEVKFYVDGDDEFPTICGTGTEDYVGGAWAFRDTYSTPFLGYPFREDGEGEVSRHGLYRWHVPDPIRFHEDLRVTVQQIGMGSEGYVDRADDVASVAYWYQREPHAPFPAFPARHARHPATEARGSVASDDR